MTPDGSWPAHHELPPEVETPMRDTPASALPTRTIVAGCFSAKSTPSSEECTGAMPIDFDGTSKRI